MKSSMASSCSGARAVVASRRGVDDVERQVLELRDVARMLSRHKLIVTVLIASFLAASVIYTVTAPKRYAASSRLLLLPVVPGSSLRASGGSGTGGPLGLDMDPATQAQVVDSPMIAARVAKSLNLTISPSRLATMVDVRSGETQILQIDTTAGSPNLATAIANGFARQYVAYRREFTAATLDALTRETAAQMAHLKGRIREIEAEIEAVRRVSAFDEATADAHASNEVRRLDELTTQRENIADQLTALRQRASDLRSSAQSVSRGGGQVIQRAASGVSPARPKAARDIPVGLLAGLLAAVISVFILEYFDDRIRSQTDLEAHSSTAVLVVVPRLGPLGRLRSSRPVLRRRESGASTDAFRRLRARLLAHGIASPGGALVVASLHDGNESAEIVARLAIALARANFRTLLLSLDVRHHRLEALLDARRDIGLTEVLMDHRPLSAVAVPTVGLANLSLVPAGSGGVENTDLFASTGFRDVLDEARQLADVVLVEAPAGSTGGDVAVLAGQADGSLLLAKVGTTRRRALRLALAELRAAGRPVLGVVLADKVRRRGSGQHVSRSGARRPLPTDLETTGPTLAGNGVSSRAARTRRST
jgi:capsular polysaccharide biosynthesis protein/Mrp family chromosome partitioning ATPase